MKDIREAVITLLIAFLALTMLTMTIEGEVIVRNIQQPEVTMFNKSGLGIDIPTVAFQEAVETLTEAVEEVVTEEPIEAPQEAKSTPQGKRVALTLSHYTDLAEENGGYAGLDAMGQKLRWGTLASNNFKKGTDIYIEHYEHLFTVSDVGSSKYLKILADGSIKVDVHVPQNAGESRSEYKQRVLKLGIIKTFGYIQG